MKGVSGFAKKIVQLKKYRTYPLIYMFIKLAMFLPIATVTVEKVFSIIKIIKTQLQNRLGSDFMNDCLVIYIEKNVFKTIDNENII